MEKFIVTEREMKRYDVLRDVLNGRITLRMASEILGICYRQMIRLKKRFILEGLKGLKRKNSSKAPNLKITPEIKEAVVRLRETLYWDFNLTHFKEKLEELHNISLSYESIRKILILAGMHERRRRRRVYRRRRRMPKAGMLVQMDSSFHRWIKGRDEYYWLLAMIDDADGYVYAEFHPRDSTVANMEVIKGYIERRGLFMALYVDRASHFKTTRHGGVHYEVDREHDDTQIQRALKEIGIEIIYANSPQAKGKVEKLFRFFQDRLCNEMRVRGIKDYEEANRFLKEEFLPWYNRRYSYEVESVYRSVPEGVNLEEVFCRKYRRRVKKDNTISFRGVNYQIMGKDGMRNFAGKWVEVYEMKGGIKIFYKGDKLAYIKLSDRGYREIREEILSERGYREEKGRRKWIPPADHPWRRMVIGRGDVTFQSRNNV